MSSIESPRYRRKSPPVSARPIVCGEYRNGRNYDNWRPHGSQDWLLIATRSGAGRIRPTHQPSFAVRPDELLLYEPDAAQDYASDHEVGHWHLLWAHFDPRPHWIPWLAWPTVAPGIHRLQPPPTANTRIHAALDRMISGSRRVGPNALDLAMNGLEEALLHAQIPRVRPTAAVIDSRIQMALAHLSTHLGQPFSLPDLARHCGLSTSRLSHLFKSQIHRTPRAMSEELRLLHARDLLQQTTLPVANVADEVGFDDPLYFSRRYRLRFAHPPSAR